MIGKYSDDHRIAGEVNKGTIFFLLGKPISRERTTTTTKLMQNITWAIRIVQNPNTTLRLRKSVSSEAPSTISGVESGRKIRMFVVARPRNAYRTSASAISAVVQVARANGCTHTIVTSREDIAKRVREITDGKGVPVVYDAVGKSTWEGSLDCLRPRGLMVSFGNASGPVPPFVSVKEELPSRSSRSARNPPVRWRRRGGCR